MKYFICGYKKLDQLPDCAKNLLCELSDRGHEFLIRKLDRSDELIQICLTVFGSRNVTVYSLKNNPDDIRDGWSFKQVKIRVNGHRWHNPYYHFDDRDLVIAQDADAGLVVWDRKDVMTFLNIVNLLLYKKPVDIVLTDDNTIFKADSIENFRTILPEKNEAYTTTWDILPEELYRKAVSGIVDSEVFCKCLLDYPVSKYSVLELVLQAPVPIEQKAELLKDLSLTDDIFNEVLDSLDAEIARKKNGIITNCANPVESVYHSISRNTITGHYEKYHEAIDELELKPGEYFYLKQVYSGGRQEGIAAFSDLESALKYIRVYEKDWGDYSTTWMSLEKWKKWDDNTDSGRLYNAYTYYLDRDRILDFSKNCIRLDGMTTFEDGYMSRSVMGMSAIMHLPTPFNVGDIVRLDCTPFGDLSYAIVLDKGGETEYYHGFHIRVLYYTGKWKIGWLETTNSSGEYNAPKISSLYRISKYDGELPFEYKLYRTIQNLINGDEKKAQEIIEALDDEDDEFFPSLEVNEFLKRMNDKVQGFSAPVNRDDEIILSEFTKPHYIRFSDIHDEYGETWPYEWEDTEVRIVKEEEYEILLAIQTKDGKDGLLIAWDKKYEDENFVSKAVGCIDITCAGGWHVALGEETGPDNRKKLKVYYFGGQLDPWSKADVICCEEPFEVDDWKEAHLEVEGNRLFLVIDGERHLYVNDLRYQKHEDITDDEEDENDGD